MMNDNIAFVLGNGISRIPFKIDQLKSKGIVYACNAVYRSDTPHHLIAVDPKMIIEIVNSKYHKDNSVYTYLNDRTKEYSDINFVENIQGWSSGPTALWLASEKSYNKIYILGFDFTGLHQNTKQNNIFAGTSNYRSKENRATIFGNWLRQTEYTIAKHPTISYVRIKTKDNYSNNKLNNFANYTEELVENVIKTGFV